MVAIGMANIKLQQSQQREKSTSLVVMWASINQNPLGRSGLSPREGWLKKETTGEEEEKEIGRRGRKRETSFTGPQTGSHKPRED